MSLWGNPKQLAQANQNPALAASTATATQYQNALAQQQYIAGTTVPVTTTGSLQGILGGTGNWNQGFSYPYPQPYPTTSVPIYPYDSKEGILLTDKEGKQHFVPIRDIAQQIGLEW